jgi:hypothetical protein
MDISKLAKKPQLIEIVVDDEGIVTEYGEPITFWMMDFIDINTYFEFFRSQTEKSGQEMNVLLRKIILKNDGTPALGDDESLPIDIAVAALSKINESLGKSKTKSLIQPSGIQPE